MLVVWSSTPSWHALLCAAFVLLPHLLGSFLWLPWVRSGPL